MDEPEAAGGSRQTRVALIVGLVVVVTFLHYGIDLRYGTVHDLLTRFYYVPIVLAGLWFGTRGGVATALAVSVVFFPHAFHGWHGPYTLVFRLIEILMYNVIGGLTGILATRSRRALEAETRARQDKEAAYETLKERTAELFSVEEQLRRSQRLASLGRLGAGLAHEIRNPLATIKASVEILRDQAARSGAASRPPGGAPDLHAVLLEESGRLDRILSEFLDFARAERQGGDGPPPSCRLAEVVARTAELLAPQLGAAAVTVRVDPAGLDVAVAIADRHLQQVLVNLFLNALDAIAGAGEIHVAVVPAAAGAVTFAVADSGPGVPAELAETIFEPFWSGRPGGTGLGLAIVDRLVDSHRGRVVLDPAHRPGARFLVTLPLAGGELDGGGLTN